MTALVVSTDVEANLAEEITLNRRKKDVEGTRKTATMAAAIGRCEITNQFGVKVTLENHLIFSLEYSLLLVLLYARIHEIFFSILFFETCLI